MDSPAVKKSKLMRENKMKEISMADALQRIAEEKGAVILGLSIRQILCITEKIEIAGINRPFVDEDIESLKITTL